MNPDLNVLPQPAGTRHPSSASVLLTGSSGFIGANVLHALRAAGHRVRTVCRGQGVDVRGMTWRADWLPYLAGIDTVINSIGIIGQTSAQRFATLHARAPIALFDACVEAGVRRVIQISALGADETARSQFHLSKRAADDHLRGLDVDWLVMRPALVYGRGGASAGLFMRLARLPWLPVVGDGRQPLQPVHVGEVVATVLQGVRARSTRQSLDLVGSETVTFADWLQALRRAQGLAPAPLLHLPPGLVMCLAQIGGQFVPMLHPDNLRMLQAGHIGDGTALHAFLGRPVRRFAPALLFAGAADAAACGGEA